MLALAGAMMGGAVAETIPGNGLTALGASSQEEDSPLAGHPMVGSWLVTTPGGPSLALFAADGSVTMGIQPTQVGVMGVGNDVTFVGAEIGTWEATGERSAHFTALQVLSDVAGTYLGTVTIDGYPVASADGQTLLDDGSQGEITVRDATGAIVTVLGQGDESLPQITGVRMGVGEPGFPDATAANSTPAA
jgi:hypothetical protein